MTRTRSRGAPSPRASSLPLDEFLELGAPSGAGSIEVDGTTLSLTHLEKLYWPRERIRKVDVIRYYARAWPLLGPFLLRRPVILKRFPRGIDGPPFFQHDLGNAPSWLLRVPLVNREGRTIHYAVIRTRADLLYLVNAGALEQHVWLSSLGSLERPDFVAVDLDPGAGASWRQIEELALLAHESLSRDFGVEGYAKTSGSRGIHVLIPLGGRQRYEELAPLCRDLARKIAGRASAIATTERSLRKRDPRKIYVDLLQNARGKSIVAPFSLRVRPGATISMPLSWERIRHGVDPEDFTLRTPMDVLEKEAEAWKGFFSRGQSLSAPSPGTSGG